MPNCSPREEETFGHLRAFFESRSTLAPKGYQTMLWRTTKLSTMRQRTRPESQHSWLKTNTRSWGDENFEKVYKYIVFADHSDHTGRHFMAWTCFLCPFEETNEFSGHESPRTRRPEDSDALDICWNSAGDKNSLIHLMRESIGPVLEALSSPPRIQTQKIA